MNNQFSGRIENPQVIEQLIADKNSNKLFDNFKPLNIYGQIRDFSIVTDLKSSDSLILIAGISDSKIITKNVK